MPRTKGKRTAELTADEWFDAEVESLLSPDDGVRNDAISRWRKILVSPAVNVIADRLLVVVKRGGPRAERAADTLVALGGPVLFRIPGCFVRGTRPAARIRLLNVMARLEPVEGIRGHDLETDILALFHRERNREVQEAFAPVLQRHARFALWLHGLQPAFTVSP